MNAAKNMDSVFSGSTNDALDFDVIFDYEDSLVDTVNGVNEAGEPLTGVDYVDLHQTQDDATAKDVRDGEADDNAMGAKNAEGTKFTDEIDRSLSTYSKKSDADDLYGTSEKDYQSLGNGPTPYTDEIEKTIDKGIKAESYLYEKCCREDDMSDIMDDEDDDIELESNGGKYTDSIEDEIRKNAVNEADGVDNDVLKVEETEDNGDDETIDIAMGIPKSSSSESTSLDYETSDEDIIDMAINGD